jgi:hypothetical protein
MSTSDDPQTRSALLDRLLANLFQEAQAFAARIAASGDTSRELDEWRKTGFERETMVSRAYSPAHVKPYLNAMQREGFSPAMIDVYRRRIREVWNQERAHAYQLDNDVVFSWSVQHRMAIHVRWWRWLKGWLAPWMLRGLMDSAAGIFNRLSARALAQPMAYAPQALRRMVDFPAFLLAFEGAFDFGMTGFCRVNEVLEQTAVDGYTRMRQLIVSRQGDPNLSATAANTVTTLLVHESWHKEIFRILADESSNGPPAGMNDAQAQLRDRLKDADDRFLAIRCDSSTSLNDALPMLEYKWANILSETAQLILGADPDQTHFVILIDPRNVVRLRPRHHKARRVKIDARRFPTLAAVCSALGRRRATVDVIWDPATGKTPVGVESLWERALALFDRDSDGDGKGGVPVNPPEHGLEVEGSKMN